MPGSGHSTDEIRTAIKQTIADVTQLQPAQIVDTALFEDLGIDSLTATEIMVHVDHKYKIRLPPEDLGKIRNVDDAVAVVLRHLH